MITELKDNQIFVFGSNIQGIHGRGAAKTAKLYFGAKNGVGEGLTGRTYAIPTREIVKGHMKTLSLQSIQKYVHKFIDFADKNPQLEFLLTEIGCGLAGYKPEDIAPLFWDGYTRVENIIYPPKFEIILDKLFQQSIDDV